MYREAPKRLARAVNRPTPEAFHSGTVGTNVQQPFVIFVPSW